MWSDVINNVLYCDMSNIFIQMVSDTIFKVFFFFMDCAERFSCLTIHFQTKETFLSNCFIFYAIAIFIQLRSHVKGKRILPNSAY